MCCCRCVPRALCLKPACACAALPCSARSDLKSTRTSVPTSSPAVSASASPLRALSNRPEIIVADEPTGALDTASTEQVFSILRDIADQGQTVVVVTHDPALAARADRRIHIVDGKIAEITERGRVELVCEAGS